MHQGHLLERELAPQVSSRHHHRVRLFDDRVDLLERDLFFDLSHHRDVRGQARTQVAHVLRRAHERQRHAVGPDLERQLEIRLIFFRQGRRRESDTRQVDPLTPSDVAAQHHLGLDPRRRHAPHAQLDLAIVEQNPVVHRQLLRQRRVGHGQIAWPSSVARRQPDALALLQVARAAQLAHTELGALQVDQQRQRLAAALSALAQRPGHGSHLFRRRVRHVETSRVHASLAQRLDRLRIGRSGSQGADDFRLEQLLFSAVHGGQTLRRLDPRQTPRAQGRNRFQKSGA